jgi:[NiFe] hydrogenase diaphorase moiety small subunit
MSNDVSIIVDGVEVTARAGQTIIEAADEAGVYIPRLCHKEGLEPYGGCRVCTVKANGRLMTACTQPVAPGMVIQNDTGELREFRKTLVEMLFVEGNHFCMVCEKSGNCELQGLAYRMGITAPRFPYLFPKRDVDASHPDILVDHNRCILCSRCVRASRDLDGKNVFQFVGRGPDRKVAVNAAGRLKDAGADVKDEALDVCPVGALLRKRTAYRDPVGQRKFDHEPIGREIEARREAEGD